MKDHDDPTPTLPAHSVAQVELSGHDTAWSRIASVFHRADPADQLVDVPSNEETSGTESEFLATYDASRYPTVALATDIVVLTIRRGRLTVLLVERAAHPYQGRWALPGGFVGADESAGQAATRELAEETGLDVSRGHLEQLATYTDPQRDPRARVVSVAHLAFVPDPPAPRAGSDAANARFWPIEDLDLIGDDDGAELAFDHAQIIADGVERARSKLEYTPLAAAFCDELFTLSDLRRVYEAVWGTSLDGANFRRKVLSSPQFVIPVGETRSGTRGRPAELYRRGTAEVLLPALLRPNPES